MILLNNFQQKQLSLNKLINFGKKQCKRQNELLVSWRSQRIPFFVRDSNRTMQCSRKFKRVQRIIWRQSVPLSLVFISFLMMSFQKFFLKLVMPKLYNHILENALILSSKQSSIIKKENNQKFQVCLVQNKKLLNFQMSFLLKVLSKPG